MSLKFDELADCAGTKTLTLVLMALRAWAGHPQSGIIAALVFLVYKITIVSNLRPGFFRHHDEFQWRVLRQRLPIRRGDHPRWRRA